MHCAPDGEPPVGSSAGILPATDLVQTLPRRSGEPDPVAGCSARRGALDRMAHTPSDPKEVPMRGTHLPTGMCRRSFV
jgi:hypothetical protein